MFLNKDKNAPLAKETIIVNLRSYLTKYQDTFIYFGI
jgi:hypothetical protein